MATKLQSSLQGPISSYSKFIKLPLNKQEKNGPNAKKIFSRKPQNSSQNSSRILSSRLKTQEDQQNTEENQYSMNNSVSTLLNQTKNIKFVSSKSSKSLQKLFVSSSVQQLPTWNILNKKQTTSGTKNDYKFNSKNNKLNQSLTFTDNNKPDFKLDIIYDFEKEDCHAQENMGSTELSSNQNICNQDFNEDDFRNSQLQRSNRNQTFSFYYPKENKHLLKECPNCLVNCQKVKDLEAQNKQLMNTVQSKDTEIKKLNDKIQKLNRTLKENENFKTNFEYEVKILKEKQTFLSSQKEEIESAYKKLQANFNKISQQMRYKDLELSISKIYKTKSHEMEMKVEALKNELSRAKCNVSKLMSSKSSGNLREFNSRAELTSKAEIYQRQNSDKKLKQPKISKVYSQDSVFSLSSQECD